MMQRAILEGTCQRKNKCSLQWHLGINDAVVSGLHLHQWLLISLDKLHLKNFLEQLYVSSGIAHFSAEAVKHNQNRQSQVLNS